MWQRVGEPQGKLLRNEPKLHFERKLKGWEMKKGREGVTNNDNVTDEGTGI